MNGRNLKPELLEYLDAKLATDPVAKAAIQINDPITLMLQAARACVGIREEGGNNCGTLVELFQETIGDAEGEPWCMSFVQSMVAYAEEKTRIGSHLFASEHCLTVWNQSQPLVTKSPKPGSIVVWRHQGTDNGHTGILDELCHGKTMLTFEGNTESGLNSNGAVERDGGGVYHSSRNQGGTGSMVVVGFLNPF